ncbi:MAG: hypothetical protein ACRD4B_08545, partial [Acidobacteriota bacterium]
HTDVFDPDLVEEVHNVAKQAIGALYRHTHQPEDPETIPDWAGVDVFVDRNGKPYVLEIETLAGGFDGVVRMDHAPLSSIASVLLSQQVPYLQEQFANRPTEINPTGFKRIQPNSEALYVQYQTHYMAQHYDAAQNALAEIAMRYPERFPEKLIQENLKNLDLLRILKEKGNL